MDFVSLLLASVVGFTHAFEADHLVAVSSIVTRRNNSLLAIKDGIYWGLGHTSTILLVGAIILLGRIAFQEEDFRYFEALVGVMLIVLGVYRLYKLYQMPNGNQHIHTHKHDSKLAYGVGLVHGLAGSGALLLTVLATTKSLWAGLAYLVIFGVGSIVGMMLAAGIFSVPFSEKILNNKTIRMALILLSSLLCMGLGSKVLYENLFA
ncbi:MAG: sulfite exporter TauE/SafE family protein [Runella sp.]